MTSVTLSLSLARLVTPSLRLPRLSNPPPTGLTAFSSGLLARLKLSRRPTIPAGIAAGNGGNFVSYGEGRYSIGIGGDLARDREVLRIRSVTLRMRLLMVVGVAVSLMEPRPRRCMLGLAVEARGRIGDMLVSSGGGGGGPGLLDGRIVPVSTDMAMLISPVLVRV